MMPFCQRKMLLCALRSAQAMSSTTSALQPLLVKRWTQGFLHAKTMSSSVIDTSVTSTAVTVPQLLSAVTSHTHVSHGSRPSSDQLLSQRLAPSSNIIEYKLPATVIQEQLSQISILDNALTTNLFYECPVAAPVVDSVAPDLQKSEILEPGSKPEAKEAKMIMRIRHKKMKKHKLKKLRKRMYFLWRKQKQTRKAKRMTIYNKELDAIKATGEQFDAEEFVRSQLTKARRGGYYINVFETKQ